MGSIGGSVAGGGAGGKVGLPAFSLPSAQSKHALLCPPPGVDFKKKKDAARELPHRAKGHCRLKDYRHRAIDFDGNFLKFHEGLYEMGDLKSPCLVNKHSPKNPVSFCGFSILKNIRHKSIITLENFYEESGQSRIVLSWVDGSFTAWMKHGGYKKSFEIATDLRGNCPSRAFRRMILDTCRGLEYLLSQNMYPISIKESDLYLCNEKEKGEGNILKMLICHVDLLSSLSDRNNRKCKLWTDVKTIFQDVCKQSDRVLTDASKSFIDFIGTGNVDKLDDFPDIWSSEKKACYLFSLMAADKSKVQSKIKLCWPAGSQLIKDLLDYERNKKSPTHYDMKLAYDYLRLCRNVIKHWKKFCANVNLLKILCPNPSAFIQKMEEWMPLIWCNLYKEIGWPEK